MPSPRSARLPELAVEGTELPCVSRGRAARILPPSLLSTALLCPLPKAGGRGPREWPQQE